ncbi:MAG: phosphoglycerate dehydrogenase [Planctomycetes bacterium]|nr:phosphoglycerate dehydrogenase [Planctomycetota bacterium]
MGRAQGEVDGCRCAGDSGRRMGRNVGPSGSSTGLRRLPDASHHHGGPADEKQVGAFWETGMVRVLITDKLAQEGIDLINATPGAEAVVKLGIGEEELANIIRDYDGLIVRSETKVTAKVLSQPGRLKGVARAGVGVDNIDVPAATRKGILVMNTPGGNTLSAAEHTMALMLAMSRNVVQACWSLKSGAWDRKKYMGNQLNNKILGVIGLGRIGMAVAHMARGFNMKVLGYDPLAAPKNAEQVGVEVTDNLERIFREADFITVHVPRSTSTMNMIGAEQMGMMKPTVRLINCARGGIINEDALYEALAQKQIAGAALDVFSEEPPKNLQFAKLDNCIVTPHLGASTEEAQVEVAVEAAEILLEAIHGGPIRNAVNAPSTAGAMPPAVNKYSDLARRIGKLIGIIAPGNIKDVQVQYRGSIAGMDVQSATLNFAIGLLQKHFDMPLNMINTPVLAKERGISIDETKNTEARDVASSFSATVATSQVTRTVRGSVFGETLLRIIEIDGFNIEMTPQGTVLVIFNDDRPGVIGAVGTLLGQHGINIGTMGVGQKPEQQKAVLAVSLDKEPDVATVEELRKLDFVNELYVCGLD